MKKVHLRLALTRCSVILCLLALFFSCTKTLPEEGVNVAPYYNLDVALLPVNTKVDDGKNPEGFIKFRQDPDTARIITLDTWVVNLKPNHAYSLQRAVDPISTADCLSTAWLTLGKGLVAQNIQTDGRGNGVESLFRNVTAVARGTAFRIHFQIIDAVSSEVVLTSGCYQYTVR